MKKLLESLRLQLDNARETFGRLTQREQMTVLGGAAFVLFLVLVTIALSVSSAIDRAERRVRVKTDQLTQVVALQDEYRSREALRQARLREVGRTTTRLVSVVEEVARQTGVEIGQLRPEDGEPTADKVYESRVDLRATGLSADRLQDFLSRLETSPGVVIVRRLKMVRPFRKDVIDVELTVMTYRVKT